MYIRITANNFVEACAKFMDHKAINDDKFCAGIYSIYSIYDDIKNILFDGINTIEEYMDLIFGNNSEYFKIIKMNESEIINLKTV